MLMLFGYISSLVLACCGIAFLTWYALYAKKMNKGKWTTSYSATYSLWYKTLKDKYALWGTYCTVTCMTYIWGAFILSTGFWQSWLAILAMAGLFIMGCFPSGCSKLQTNIHCIAVQVSIWSTLAWVALHGFNYWWVFLSAFIPPFIPWAVNKYITKKIPDGLLVEWSAFVATFLWLGIFSIVSMC